MGMAKVAIQIGFSEDGTLQCAAPNMRPEQIVFLLEKAKYDLLASIQVGPPPAKIEAVPAGALSMLPGANGRN